MRNAHGYSVRVDPDPPKGEVGTQERDIISCYHCSCWTRVKAGENPDEAAPLCGKCGFHICKACKARGGCHPVEMMCELLEGPTRKLEAAIRQDEDHGRFLREVFGAS